MNGLLNSRRVFLKEKQYTTWQDVKQTFAFVDIWIVDLFGKIRHVTLPSEYVSDEVMQNGIGFDASNLKLADVTNSDLVIKPDLATAFEDPFSPLKTLNVMGTIYQFNTKMEAEMFPFDSRVMLQHTVEWIRKQGVANHLQVLPELEFYLFDEVDISSQHDDAYFSFYSNEKHLQSSKGYHLSKPFDQLSDLRSEIVAQLLALGIPVKYHHHEVGYPGQCEIELDFQDALKAADSILIAKYVIHNLARKHDKVVNFMPKPIYGMPGSGMHLHMFLADAKGKSLFFDKNGEHRLSTLAWHYMGGVLLHLPALMAFSNPSTNSYKRLIPGYEAPCNKSFAKSNRDASIRIPAYTPLEETRFELRTADALANPYYTLSAVLLAGADGIKHQIDPHDHQAIKIEEKTPHSLISAMDALLHDQSFLKPIMSEAFLETWKKQKLLEANKCTYYPNPAEFETYLDY